jgi:hypothetical protein
MARAWSRVSTFFSFYKRERVLLIEIVWLRFAFCSPRFQTRGFSLVC